MTAIGFKPSEHRKWQFTLKGRKGTIFETVTPNGFYQYDWQHIGGDAPTRFNIVTDDHHLPKEEVEAKARAREHEV
jgi:hypothetical protein